MYKLFLAPYEKELRDLDHAVLRFAQRFGDPHALGLNEVQLSLHGFMAAVVGREAFEPRHDATRLIQQGYNALTNSPHASPMMVPVEWMARMVRIEKAIKETRDDLDARSEVRRLVSRTYIDTLDTAGSALIGPTLDRRAIGELKDAIDTCIRLVLTRRLVDAQVSEDFPELTYRTSVGTIFYAMLTRALRHTLYGAIQPVQLAMQEGVLPLGDKDEKHGNPSILAVRFFKTKDDQGKELDRQTVAVSVPIVVAPSGTLIGVLGNQGADPRNLLMQRIKEAATLFKVNERGLNMPYRLWNRFAKTHLDLRGFAFGTATEEESLIATNVATGQKATIAYLIGVKAVNDMTGGTEKASAKVVLNTTIGQPIWKDSFDREETDVQRRAIKDAFLEIQPNFVESLQKAGIGPTAAPYLCRTILQTFCYMFHAAFLGLDDRVMCAARLIDLFTKGVVPIGIAGAVCTAVRAD